MHVTEKFGLAVLPPVGLFGALLIIVSGSIWAYISRLPLIEILTTKQSRRLSRGIGFRQSEVLREVRDTTIDGLEIGLQLERIDPQTHEIVCTMVISVPRTLIASLRRIVVGPGAVGDHPLVVINDSTSGGHFMLQDHDFDPEITLEVLFAYPDLFRRSLLIRWKITELISAIEPQGPATITKEIRLHTVFQVTTYPSDRYKTYFWMWLHVPPGCYFSNANAGAKFIAYPSLSIRCGAGLLHWDTRLRNLPKPVDETQIVLQRHWTERGRYISFMQPPLP